MSRRYHRPQLHTNKPKPLGIGGADLPQNAMALKSTLNALPSEATHFPKKYLAALFRSPDAGLAASLPIGRQLSRLKRQLSEVKCCDAQSHRSDLSWATPTFGASLAAFQPSQARALHGPWRMILLSSSQFRLQATLELERRAA